MIFLREVGIDKSYYSDVFRYIQCLSTTLIRFFGFWGVWNITIFHGSRLGRVSQMVLVKVGNGSWQSNLTLLSVKGIRFLILPSSKLTYPAWGKGKSYSKVPTGRGYVSFQEGNLGVLTLLNISDSAAPRETFFNLKLTQVQSSQILTHTIHVWYIYPHLADLYGFHVGKYAKHGSYGWVLALRKQCPLWRTAKCPVVFRSRRWYLALKHRTMSFVGWLHKMAILLWGPKTKYQLEMQQLIILVINYSNHQFCADHQRCVQGKL